MYLRKQMYLFSTLLVQTHTCFLHLWHEWSNVALYLPINRDYAKKTPFPFLLFKFVFPIIIDAIQLCTFLILTEK